MSTTAWSKGPICGVDNCRSRLYRSLDGFKICQYGHVRQDDVEINDEEDDMMITTRRLKVPSQLTQQSQGGKEKRLYGLQGRVKFFECFQYLLHKQCEIVIKEFAISNADEFKQMVKLHWIKYLQYNNTKSEKFDYNKLPQLIDSLVIVYLSCYSLQIPIYMIDIQELVNNNILIYMTATSSIPSRLKENLTSNYMRILTPRTLPNTVNLYKILVKMHNKFDINVNFNYSGLVLNFLQRLVLPLEIYNVCFKLVKQLDIKMDSDPMTSEIRVISLIIISAQLFFYEHQDLLTKWVNVLERVPKLDDIAINNVQELIDWDNEKIEKYLNQMSSFVMKDDDENVNIAKKRVLDIFKPTLKGVESTTIVGRKSYYDLYDEVEIVNTVEFDDVESFLMDNFTNLTKITKSQIETVYNGILKMAGLNL